MTKRLKRVGAWALKSAVTTALLYAVVRAVPLADVWRSLASVDLLPLAGALLLLGLSRALMAWRTKCLADKQGLSLSLWQIIEIGYAAMFYGLFLPGTLSGGAIRWYKLARQDGKPSEAITLIFFERIADTMALAAVGLGCLALGTPAAQRPLLALGFSGVLGILGVFYLIAFHRRVSGALIGRLHRRDWSWVPEQLRGALKELVASARRYHRVSGRFLAAIAVLSAAAHVAGVASFWILLRALALPVGAIDAGWVRSALMLVTMLPIALAGFGLREGALVMLLRPLGVVPADAIALSLLKFLTTFSAALIGGVLELRSLWWAKRARSKPAEGAAAAAGAASAAPASYRRSGTGRERITAVILNYNKREELMDCLASVRRLAFPPSEIIVVDNGSHDGSAEAVARAFPEVRVVCYGNNLGAVRGRNAGWREAMRRGATDGILFLDNDTVVTRDCLTHLVEAMRRDPRAGVFCGKGYMRFPSRTLMSAGMTVNRYTGSVRDRGAGCEDDGRYARSEHVDACGGFAFLVRSEVLRELDGLDERFSPLGWEDVDFCLRAKARGYATRYVPEAVVHHSGGTLGRGYVFARERLKVRNYLLLLSRHTTWLQRLSCALCLPVRAVSVLGTLLAHGQARIAVAHWHGLREGISALRESNTAGGAP